jgi:hypothetical protein
MAGVRSRAIDGCPDHPSWILQIPVVTTLDQSLSRGRSDETKQHPHGRRLSGAVGTNKPGDRPGPDLETRAIDSCSTIEQLRHGMEGDRSPGS